ncbi:MAG: hypothetical protein COU21_02690 [Candidatus Komeilibacteria bacterium CG10_big_fil_rev_8_21_14_0_10_36_65]|nr:MAG: hypothetical protein COU21_02690 [Candidatus Komeilibacteria bacterium CG10_big_fil_rev_8_21_14_0_10_36_65]PJC55084.1 MAG: hypothetical protein CO027_03905 [Candidatus Komeilibacteria bacterium CG_4_9_14_0_2_um_filter_36_13]
MSIKIFKKEDSISRKISDSYSILNFLTSEDSDKISLAIGTARNHNEITQTTRDRVYYMVEGKIIINDNIEAGSGDVIFIPANTGYQFKGSFKVVIVNSPPFKKDNESIYKL